MGFWSSSNISIWMIENVSYGIRKKHDLKTKQEPTLFELRNITNGCTRSYWIRHFLPSFNYSKYISPVRRFKFELGCMHELMFLHLDSPQAVWPKWIWWERIFSLTWKNLCFHQFMSTVKKKINRYQNSRHSFLNSFGLAMKTN